MAVLTSPNFWTQEEPDGEAAGDGDPLHACYSKQLKADLASGTFVLLSSGTTTIVNGADTVVASIVKAVGQGRPLFSVQVNIFKKKSEVLLAASNGGGDGRFVRPLGIVDNHLCHIPEVIQTTEVRIVSMAEIVNVAFVFTEEALKDNTNLYFTCQGMVITFLLRYRADWTRDGNQNSDRDTDNREILALTKIPVDCCFPFLSSYQWS